jgi:murein DD-endopeptidase MepM/ murein hydrolase activator NlpD
MNWNQKNTEGPQRAHHGVRMIKSITSAFAKEGIAKVAARLLALAGLTIAAPAMAADGHDAQFSSLFSSMLKMEQPTEQNVQTKASIPSRQPVDDVRLTSAFGTRSDPFTGRARMHQGIDIPGPIGTPIYATADGVVRRAQWANGYGNLVEINHGNGLETRYGHLSKLIAQPNERVRRGQLIGFMGSTGRSTGSHLHYEVRIAGSAVNPIPYLEGTNYELALAEAKQRSDRQIAMGGPEANRPSDNRDR